MAGPIYIHGNGFVEPVTVKLDETSLNITYVDYDLIVAYVPAGLSAGFYDITVETADDDVTEVNAYQALDPVVVDDLVSSPEWLWSDPFPMRVGYTNSGVGLNVQRLGGRNTLDSVTVEFRLDSVAGQLLGRGETNLLDPYAIESSQKVVWQPNVAGTYRVCAIIDPDNEVRETNESNNVTCRSLSVLEGATDQLRPDVNSFVIEDGAQTTSDQAVTLDISATDNPNGSGVRAIKFLEFEYSLGARDWVLVQNSDWVNYATAQENYPWSLIPTYGVRYLEARAIDYASNISRPPASDTIDLLPSEQTGYVARNGVTVYRIYLEEGEDFAATLTPITGDPDLYVWGPNGERWESNDLTGVETIAFQAADTGTYQIEVHGYNDAEYRLSFGSIASIVQQARMKAGPKPLPEAPAMPLDVSPPEYYNIELPAEEHRLYLPITIGQ